MISVRLGVRNLARNRWRSVLTLAGISVSVALMVWTLAFYEGWLDEMVRGATSVETGQVQVHSAAYVDRPRLYESFSPDRALRSLTEVPGVLAASPRVELHGLVGNESRSQVARILGVDPARESATTPIEDALVAGRWLAATEAAPGDPREAVLGEGVARQLRAVSGDELVVFAEAADGSLGNELLVVVGVVRTGNTQLDRTTLYLNLFDAQFMAALPGEVNEIALRTADLANARETAATVAEALGARLGAPPDDEGQENPRLLVVRPWQELLPGIEQMIVLFRRSYWILYLLVYLVAAVGILNTQRMSALERRREFGVMMAIGMRPRRMFRTLQIEALVLGVAGSLLGALGGGLLAWYHQTAGFDLTTLTDQAAFTYMGVAFSERLHFVLTPAAVVQPVLVMLAVGLVSALWPALTAARIDPAPTIAGRT